MRKRPCRHFRVSKRGRKFLVNPSIHKKTMIRKRGLFTTRDEDGLKEYDTYSRLRPVKKKIELDNGIREYDFEFL
jgi:hypothetical protein